MLLPKVSHVWGATSCRSRQTARWVRTQASQLTDVRTFIEEIAVTRSPKHVGALTRVLEGQGCKAVLPTDRQGLHPLLVPLCHSGNDTVTCLLRWPEPSKHKDMPLPVVRMQRGAKTMTLVARSVDEYLHRLLAEEDIQLIASDGLSLSSPRPVTASAGPECAELYRAGDAAAAGYSGAKAQLYVVKKAGYFPDVCEALSHRHLAKGDQVSALVASEWQSRNDFFPGWARPYEFASELFTQLNRGEEARDMARVALRLPWWSLQKSFAEVQRVAHLEGKTPEEVRYLLSEEAASAAQAQSVGARASQPETKSQQQLGLEKAASLLDMAAAGQGDYDSVRPELGEAYLQAGLSDVAGFVTWLA
mmetsp:Transcript_7094/g.12149  ORF Transcript_7094/g.12149 Transcript_7094/m.12149 type:complete len:362 (+) Transcript_7094:136-1221(+)|eukprot:CAMPEP_0119115514 /NCGR_PEP_ID=MMETSP1180-20130426/51199_1 /TAXON_ID=3052 ORGANISM="Chlamydomonas cf sp, Strain CCMP681" /NCGR_SAMPLE_ID=MMETSP1180 /ASSEMBLY_ACC=CAM_ASM_000741 /LENGTH=361 /DNA_ID=CAMNT_0007104521 /DNA_START=58 /DNA_END=1143 /DNA_ORIENTATION=+